MLVGGIILGVACAMYAGAVMDFEDVLEEEDKQFSTDNIEQPINDPECIGRSGNNDTLKARSDDRAFSCKSIMMSLAFRSGEIADRVVHELLGRHCHVFF